MEGMHVGSQAAAVCLCLLRCEGKELWCHEGPTDLVAVWSVELQVKRPLMPVQLSPEQVGLEMWCLCGQLDLLIRAQMQQVGVTPTATADKAWDH